MLFPHRLGDYRAFAAAVLLSGWRRHCRLLSADTIDPWHCVEQGQEKHQDWKKSSQELGNILIDQLNSTLFDSLFTLTLPYILPSHVVAMYSKMPGFSQQSWCHPLIHYKSHQSIHAKRYHYVHGEAIE